MSYFSCMSCKSKVDSKTDKIGICTKCSLSQKITHCPKQYLAKLHLRQIGSNGAPIVANAFGNTIKEITALSDDIEPTEEALFDAEPFRCIITNDVINSVDRCMTD